MKYTGKDIVIKSTIDICNKTIAEAKTHLKYLDEEKHRIKQITKEITNMINKTEVLRNKLIKQGNKNAKKS